MSDPKKRRNDRVVWVAVGIALPVLYVLGSGPAYWAGTRGWVPKWLDDPLQVLYQPLERACGKEGTMHDLLWSYRNLFAPPMEV